MGDQDYNNYNSGNNNNNYNNPYNNPYNNNQYGSNQNQNRPPDRSVNVTQPRENTSASIDTSRVSAYTMREQQALERLKRQVGNPNQKERRLVNIKTIVAIIVIILLLLLAVVFVILIGKTTSTSINQYDIRLSMQIENKSALSVLTSDGREKLREINPGDTIPLRATIRNANEFYGDTHDEEGTPPAIFVRFRLLLVLDYEDRYDILKPEINENLWYFDENEHFYYFVGSISFQQSEALFTSITFDGDSIVCEDGGKYGQIQVKVESIEANVNAIMDGGVWQSSPSEWRSAIYRLEF